jgi:hypothetical protein
VEVVEAVQERQRAVFLGAQTQMISEEDGQQQPYQEQAVAFHQYYRGAVLSHTMPAQLRQYGLLLVM